MIACPAKLIALGARSIGVSPSSQLKFIRKIVFCILDDKPFAVCLAQQLRSLNEWSYH